MMNFEGKDLMKMFKRNSTVALVAYLIALAVTVLFTFQEYDQVIETSVKLGAYALYLGVMIGSILNLKNLFDATRADDYSMDIMIYAIIGIPLFIVSYFYIHFKLKSVK